MLNFKDFMESAAIARASSMCPFCGKTVHESDFHDTLSVKEFGISGMCQACQDDFFTEE